MKTRLLLLLVAATSLSATPSLAQIVTNGGFETPATPAGSFTLFNAGSSLLTGWNVVGGQVATVSNTFTQNGLSFVAQSGSAWLDLTGFNANGPEGVTQTIATVPGTQYTVTFWVGNVVNPGGIFGNSSTVNMALNGSPFFTATNTGGAGTSTQFWQQFSTQFTATGTSTTLGFFNGDPSTDNSNGLDNIVVTGQASTIPEPGTLVMLATGLAGFLPLARRRTR